MMRKMKRSLSGVLAMLMLIGMLTVGVISNGDSSRSDLTLQEQFADIQSYANADEGEILDLNEDVKFFGRTYESAGVHYINWTNCAFEFSFYGTDAAATLHSNNPGGTHTAYLVVYVDGVESSTIEMTFAKKDVTLASDLTKGNHTIRVVKRTNARSSTAGVSAIWINDGGVIRQTQQYYDRQMLFLGDSITVGYGSIGTSSDSWSTATEDGTVTYAALTADYFGAENHTVAVSGRGIVKNVDGDSDDYAPAMFEYEDWHTKIQWDHTKYQPDVVVINYGTNDNSASVDAADFKLGCKDFIRQVRAAYPDAVIIYAYGFMGTTYATQVQEAVNDLTAYGYGEIYYLPLDACSSSEKAVSSHPSAAAHADRSEDLIAIVEKVTGWTGADSAGNPIDSTTGVDSNYAAMDETTDIKVMSYNVLDYHGDDESYDTPANRLSKVTTIINAYDPDLIGIQEAGGVTGSGDALYDWPTKLTAALSDEYSYISLGDQSGGPGDMTIAHGLIMFYRTDRFTVQSNGCSQLNFTVTTDGETRTDESRWFQWCKLKDNEKNTSLYFYNTHYSVTSSGTDADVTNTYKIRTLQAQEMATDINSRAINFPVFATGDYNSTLKQSESTDSTLWHLQEFFNYDFLKDAACIAPYTRFNTYSSTVDHIIVNSNYVDVLEFHMAKENVDGRRPSDHYPIIAHANYTTDSTFASGTYDKAKGQLTDTSDTTSYTFDITTPSDNVTYKIYESGTAIDGNTTTLDDEVNRYIVRFFNTSYSTSTSYNTVEIHITRTSPPTRPVVTSDEAINIYFANGGYHLLTASDSVTLSISGGTLYRNPYCNQTYETTLAVRPGRQTYFIKSSGGDKYPLYIYQETDAADESSKVLYLDDDIGDATGKVAFYNGEKVIFVQGQEKGFGTIASVAAICNKANGYTVYFGSGHYKNSSTYFNKNVTLLGSNYDVSAVDPHKNEWQKSGRRAETVIDGCLYFYRNGSQSVTVKGFTVQGESTYGPLYFNTTAALDSQVQYTLTMDIQNNVLTGWGTASNASAIHANNGIQKTGVISNNFFRCTANQQSGDVDGKYTRGIFMRNPNGLTIDTNYFLGYETSSWLSAEVENANKTIGGNINVTYQSNRFELCGSNTNYLLNVTSETGGNVSYLNNDFIRCGNDGFSSARTIYFVTTESTLGIDFSKCKFSLVGNRFLNCARTLQLYRNTATTHTGDMAEMKINLNNNLFLHPSEYKTHSTNIYSIYFNFLVDSTMEHNVTVSDSMWNFDYNYFYSPCFASTNPSKYIRNQVTYNSTTDVCFNLGSSHYSPYFTNQAMTTLNSGSLASQSISITSYNASYDGNPHSITVNGLTSDAVVGYSLDKDATNSTRVYSPLNPTFTEITPSTTVYVRVERPGYTTYYGSGTVCIFVADRSNFFNNASFVYDGEPHSLASGEIEYDEVYYTFADTKYDTMPSFTDVGVYPVTAYVTNPYYGSCVDTATLTITQASLSSISVTGGYTGIYDGEEHTVAIDNLPTNANVAYSVDGGEYTATAPVYKNVCSHTVDVKVGGGNYVQKEYSFKFEITPAIITGISVTGYEGAVDGQSHGITVTGTQDGDKVYYSVNGGEYTTTVPAPNKEGTYLIAVRIDRTNYDSKHFVTQIILGDANPNLFTLTCSDTVVTDLSSGKSNMTWNTVLDLSEDAINFFAANNVTIVSYGVKYAQNIDDLTEYAHLMKTGQDTSAYSSKVVEIVSAESTTGLNPLYRTTTFIIKNVAPLKARFAMPYIRYVVDGVTYEEFGAINASSTYLDNGGVNGTGDTEDREDILDNSTIEGEGDTVDRDDILDD